MGIVETIESKLDSIGHAVAVTVETILQKEAATVALARLAVLIPERAVEFQGWIKAL